MSIFNSDIADAIKEDLSRTDYEHRGAVEELGEEVKNLRETVAQLLALHYASGTLSRDQIAELLPNSWRDTAFQEVTR